MIAATADLAPGAWPEVLRVEEAAFFLRLVDEGAAPDVLESGRRCVLRLIREGGLRGFKASKSYIVSLEELRRWVRAATEAAADGA